MPRHVTPDWMDELFKREVITKEKYIKTFKIIPKIRLSPKFESFTRWQRKTTSKTTAYQKRIVRYLLKHPTATLAQARGHGR